MRGILRRWAAQYSVGIRTDIEKCAAEIRSLDGEAQQSRTLLGALLEKIVELGAESIVEAEFGVFSQWGEDGILSFLCQHISNSYPNTFVEFGVESYREANTRWLVEAHNWEGLVIDGSEANIHALRQDPIYWKHQLKSMCAFVTRENINELIKSQGIEGELGILSVDIDGVDYWVWEAITVVDPAIVVVEYNSLFGPDAAVTVPYDAGFVREKAHYSFSYYGASLEALACLGRMKGYALVGSNSAGNNAFFVKCEMLNEKITEVSAQEAYVRRSFREARDRSGNLTFPTFEEEQELIKGLPLVEISE